MKIVFVSIFDLTEVFYQISIRLSIKGHDVFWIANSSYWYDWLISKGVDEKRILLLRIDSSYLKDYTLDNNIIKMMRECEIHSEITFNEAILMDRFVVSYEEDYINLVTQVYYSDIKKFLKNNNINITFAEPTNLHEIVCYMVCEELNIYYISPWDMRFPSYRLIFTKGIYQSKIIERKFTSNELDASKVLNNFIKNTPQPSYVSILNKKISFITIIMAILEKIKKQFSIKKSLTYYSFLYRTKEIIKKIIGKMYLSFISRELVLQSEYEYALFPLHVQPENSIDVLGSFYSNQIELVKNIVRSLPYGMKLLVKEHSNSLGSKGYRFYRELKNIKNVELIGSQNSNFQLYKEVKIVFSISGTSCYESAMLGIPSIVFTPIFFDGFSTIRCVKDIKNLKESIHSLLSDNIYSKQKDIEHMKYLLNNSFNCYWTDPLHNKIVLEESNIECLSDAFLSLLCSIKKI